MNTYMCMEEREGVREREERKEANE